MVEGKTPKKTLEQKNFKELPLTTFMPNPLKDFILSSKDHDLNIHCLRIITILLLRLKNEQMRTEKEVTLFHKEWMTEKEEAESMAMRFFIKDFTPEGSKNSKPVIEALDTLAKTIKVNFVNEKGEKIILTDNILGYSYNTKKKGITISMRGYWYKNFLDLSRTSNEFPKSIIFNLSSVNSVTFYFWLKSVPLGTTTQLTMENINSKFRTAYAFPAHMEKNIILPLKEEYDRSCDLSFRYAVLNNKFHITPYETTNSVPEVYSQEDYSIVKAIVFKKKKYNLSAVEEAFLEDIYLRYSYEYVHQATARKPSLKNLKGMEYVKEVSNLVKSFVEQRLKKFEIDHLANIYPEKKREFNKKYHADKTST